MGVQIPSSHCSGEKRKGPTAESLTKWPLDDTVVHLCRVLWSHMNDAYRWYSVTWSGAPPAAGFLFATWGKARPPHE